MNNTRIYYLQFYFWSILTEYYFDLFCICKNTWQLDYSTGGVEAFSAKHMQSMYLSQTVLNSQNKLLHLCPF